MPDWEVDKLTGAPVLVVQLRQDRPNQPADDCPFCPGGLEAPDPYDVHWFPNRWPVLPDDRCEVVLYSPDHDASLAALGVEGAARVVELWAERTAALGARADVAYVLVFENRGAEVGSTIDHPHGQIYAFAGVPPAAMPELEGPCAICMERPGDRLVSETDGWRAWVPALPAWPFELLLAPDDHRADLVSVDSVEMAEILVDALTRLDRVYAEPMPYMLWIHQRPTDGGDWPHAHVHVHIAPSRRAPGIQRFVAAGELGSGVWFNPVAADEAAAQLRAV